MLRLILSAFVLLYLCRLLADMVMPFPVSQEEITLSMSPLRVSLRNYCEGGNGELTLHCDLAQAQESTVSDPYHKLFKKLLL